MNATIREHASKPRKYYVIIHKYTHPFLFPRVDGQLVGRARVAYHLAAEPTVVLALEESELPPAPKHRRTCFDM